MLQVKEIKGEFKAVEVSTKMSKATALKRIKALTTGSNDPHHQVIINERYIVTKYGRNRFDVYDRQRDHSAICKNADEVVARIF